MVTRPGQAKSESKERASDRTGRSISRGAPSLSSAAESSAQEAAIEALLLTSSWEVEHVRQVRRLAVQLFDRLREYHGFGAPERELLEAGSQLHDVGYPIDPAAHHKVSARIIRANLGAPFSAKQVQIIALLARYHRKGIPRLDQRRYAQLDDRGRRLVGWLGGILRVADGLDRSHDSAIRRIGVTIVEGRLEIRVSDRIGPLTGQLPSGDPERLLPHLLAATDKRKLLEQTIGMPVVIRAV